MVTPRTTPRFRFESFWIHRLGFLKVVHEAWDRETPQALNHLLALHIKLNRTTKALRAWAKALLSHCRLIMAICKEIIGQLEKAQDYRGLAHHESQLIRTLKRRLLGLAVVEKSRARQKSRITCIRKGDANMKYFHLVANIRK
jgi:hypothetical protein